MKISREVATGYLIEACRFERVAETPRQWLRTAQAWRNVVDSVEDGPRLVYAMRRYLFCIKLLERRGADDELKILGEK